MIDPKLSLGQGYSRKLFLKDNIFKKTLIVNIYTFFVALVIYETIKMQNNHFKRTIASGSTMCNEMHKVFEEQ